MRYSRGIRRSCEPGMRYPFRRPESNHLLTVRGATLQILATCPVVKTFIAGSPFITLCFRKSAHPGGSSSLGEGRFPCRRLGSWLGTPSHPVDVKGNRRAIGIWVGFPPCGFRSVSAVAQLLL